MYAAGEGPADPMTEIRADLQGACLLWDIDGTLVEHAPSARDRHAHAVSLVLDVSAEAVMAGTGKTDRQIVTEIIAMHVDPSDELVAAALAQLDQITADDLREFPSTAIAGVAELLAELQSTPVASRLLTGNTPRRAELKVESAGLGANFLGEDGFYGDRHASRFDLVADAAGSLAIDPTIRPIIIGDTPLDIAAARSARFPVISDATGTTATAELAALKPDALLVDFSGGPNAFIAALLTALRA